MNKPALSAALIVWSVTPGRVARDLKFSRPQPSGATFDRIVLKLDLTGRLIMRFTP